MVSICLFAENGDIKYLPSQTRGDRYARTVISCVRFSIIYKVLTILQKKNMIALISKFQKARKQL